MKIIRWVLIAVRIALAVVACAGFYTSTQLAIARAKGEYSTPEEGMRARRKRTMRPTARLRSFTPGQIHLTGASLISGMSSLRFARRHESVEEIWGSMDATRLVRFFFKRRKDGCTSLKAPSRSSSGSG
jgi:hypothetical protein